MVKLVARLNSRVIHFGGHPTRVREFLDGLVGEPEGFGVLDDFFWSLAAGLAFSSAQS